MSSSFIFIIGTIFCFVALVRVAAIGMHVYRTSKASYEDFRLWRSRVTQITELITRESSSLALERRGWRGWRPMTVVRIVKETDDCTSFYLKDADDQPLPPFLPGQFITIGLPDETGRTLSRCYSLSDAPDWRTYRITVKRVPGGSVSNLLHDRVRTGTVLQVLAPSGKFVAISQSELPLVLIAAGIGVTPMVSIIKHVERCQPTRAIHLFFQVRNLNQAPLLKEIARWASSRPNARLYLYLSQPDANPPSWIQGTGRLTAVEVLRTCGRQPAQYMLCGPASMQESIQQDLIAGGVDPSMVMVEAFESIQKLKHTAEQKDSSPENGAAPCVAVRFERSEKNGVCDASTQSLLEIGESLGVTLDSGCRAGDCGACVVKLLKGQVRYAKKPSFGPLETGQALACVAIPSESVVVDA